MVATGPATEFGRVAASLVARPPETEFERGTRRFGFLILQVVIFLVLFVFLVNALLKRDLLETFLFSVALAVGLTPELLPMIVSVTLASGAVRMARKKVIVKQLAAIENFGSMDILCSDKTGTLTHGEITVDRHLNIEGENDEAVIRLAALNSVYQTGLRSPMDDAILKHEHPAVAGHERVDEIPFDFERRRVSVIVRDDGRRLLITKGAPESVLPICTALEVAEAAAPLDAPARATADALFRRLSADGYRVLAVAYRPVAEQGAYSVADERELIFVGFAAFLDPPHEGVAETLRTLRADGIEVKIITGDNELVTRKICREVGLDAGAIVLGEEVERMSDPALGAVAERTTVFARVSPIQKNRIVRALHARGHVVGCLGDGINDAPALRSADVGISVAERGGRGAGRGRHHPAREATLGAPRRRRRGAPELRQHHEVRPDGHQLQLRQHAEHGGGLALPALPPDAAAADPAQQLPVRSRPGADPVRSGGRRLHAEAQAVEYRRSSAGTCC